MIKQYLLLALIIFSPMGFAEKAHQPHLLASSIAEILNKTEYSNFSGVVLVSVGDEVITNIGVGHSDVGRAIPFSNKTMVTIGSITKQFTAAAILKLEMQGKLSTQDKASLYVPRLDGLLKTVTIHQLLTHTAGITEKTGDDDATISSVGLVNHLNDLQLSHAIGTYHYSNLGYSLLALIVENVSGKPLDKFLAKAFFKPIGMSKTGYTHPDYKDNEVSRGYLNGKDWGYLHHKNWDHSGPYWNLRGNGGMLSTAEDMLKWHHALRTNHYLSESAKAKYFAMHVREMPDVESYYGYGWVTEILPNKQKMIWHNGGNGIFSADVRYYPSANIYYFLAGNRSDGEVFDLSDEIHALVSSL